MIKSKDLIALFERMAREKWTYTWGAAKEGNVDCSGAFVWAFGQFGESIYHGSNTMARKDVSALRPANEARPGWAVFKVRKWTEAESGNRWYGSEPGDIYHVGLMGTGGKVLNAQSTRTGFVESLLDASWDYAAPLNDVDYTDEEGEMMEPYKAKVVLENEDSYLNVRSAPQGDRIGKLIHGQRVTVQAMRGDWAFVSYGDSGSGYVSAKYLERIEEAPGNDTGEIHVQLVFTDSAGNQWIPVGDFRAELRAVSDD